MEGKSDLHTSTSPYISLSLFVFSPFLQLSISPYSPPPKPTKTRNILYGWHISPQNARSSGPKTAVQYPFLLLRRPPDMHNQAPAVSSVALALNCRHVKPGIARHAFLQRASALRVLAINALFFGVKAYQIYFHWGSLFSQ